MVSAIVWTLHRSVRTEDATLPRMRAHDGVTADALVEVEAEIFRDCFNPAVIAARTSNQGFHVALTGGRFSCQEDSVNGAKVVIPGVALPRLSCLRRRTRPLEA